MYVEGTSTNIKILASRACLSSYERNREQHGVNFEAHAHHLNIAFKLATAAALALTIGAGITAFKTRQTPALATVFSLAALGTAYGTRKAAQLARVSGHIVWLCEEAGSERARQQVQQTARLTYRPW